MKIISTHFHSKDGEKETCTALIGMGKYRIVKEVNCYRLPGDVWRMVNNHKEVKIN
tara:strand:- start:2479 stop:2646 length:168 start_codon:yes stop_codon:yes gene_type:complete